MDIKLKLHLCRGKWCASPTLLRHWTLDANGVHVYTIVADTPGEALDKVRLNLLP